MRARHKTPTLFSMWMLDVFCCALGCAVLLWTLESLRASLMTEEAAASKENYEQTQKQLVASQSNFDQTQKELLAIKDELAKTKKELNSTISDLRGQLAALTNDKEDLEKKLIKANADLANTRTALALATSDLADAKKKLAAANLDLTTVKDEFAKASTKAADLDEEMRKKVKAIAEMNARLAAMAQTELDLKMLLRTSEKDREGLTIKLKSTEERLIDLDAKMRATAKDATKDAVDLASARDLIKKLQQQVDNANLSIIDLQGDKRKLADKIDKLRLESDSRFAGVAMTGKRVVFVVDISGSMKLVDEKTPDANKWPGVVETVGKVMRSIPELEKYQVIIFSRNAKYLFEKADWRDYKGEASVKEVGDALIKTVVGGDTNMYEAFDLAFKLRNDGLDTIYFFSDGLPTSGAGLTPEQDTRLTEQQRTEVLSRHIRTTLKTTWNRLVDSKRVRINSIGFFFESPEVGAFLWALSRENDGSFVGMSKP